jgi:ABC-2 type transport system permease protein
MRLYWEVARREFRRYLTYRTAVFAGLFTNYIFGYFNIAVLLALQGDRPEVNGMTPADTVMYAILTQAVVSYTALFGWFSVGDAVYSGEVSQDLLKPMAFQRFWLARDAGRATAALMLRGVLIVLLYIPFVSLKPPPTAVHGLALIPAIFFSWLLAFGWGFLTNLSAFWTPNARGIVRLNYVLLWLFSGFLIPLRFFPAWMQQVAYWTPFPGMLAVPLEIYLGLVTGWELVSLLVWQALWALLLLAVGRLVLRTAVRRLVILGG